MDLGTGSGAIALALGSECPAWHILAVDSSIEALKVAEVNKERCEIKNIVFNQSDWFQGIAVSEKCFDVIVSNPPYIDETDPYLCNKVRAYEPVSALISAKKGFEDLEKIIFNSCNYLNNNGKLYVEHGFQQGDQVASFFKEAGFLEVKKLYDLSGKWRATSGMRG